MNNRIIYLLFSIYSALIMTLYGYSIMQEWKMLAESQQVMTGNAEDFSFILCHCIE